MSKATPEEFQFSVKVPETITHIKRLRVEQRALGDFEEFLDKNITIEKSKQVRCSVVSTSSKFYCRRV
jgi:uncharacterized protein YecE (DUF72 family)